LSVKHVQFRITILYYENQEPNHSQYEICLNFCTFSGFDFIALHSGEFGFINAWLTLGIASDNLARRAKNFVQPNHHE